MKRTLDVYLYIPSQPHLVHALGPALWFAPLHQRNDGRTLALRITGVGVRQPNETLRVLRKVAEVSLLNTACVEADFPPAVERHHLVRFVVQMANVKGLKKKGIVLYILQFNIS